MILLRRGRPAYLSASSLDIEVAIDLVSVQGQQQRGAAATWRPPLEVFETDAALVVRAEIGGLSSGDVDIQISGDVLSIRGERSVSRPTGLRMYHESRIPYGSFEAVVRLPFPVQAETATAEYIDGFLSVVLPRLPATTVSARDEATARETQRGDR